ncbi:hypothetical protein [Sinomicrobium kalidii]|nr:hypothetical protein [Sinomicrobium kalidii]
MIATNAMLIPQDIKNTYRSVCRKCNVPNSNAAAGNKNTETIRDL